MAIHFKIQDSEVNYFMKNSEGEFTRPYVLKQSVKNRWVSLVTDLRDDECYVCEIKIIDQIETPFGTIFKWKKI